MSSPTRGVTFCSCQSGRLRSKNKLLLGIQYSPVKLRLGLEEILLFSFSTDIGR